MLEVGTCISGTLLCLDSQCIGAAVCLVPRHPAFFATSGSQAMPDPVSLASAVLPPDSVAHCVGHGRPKSVGGCWAGDCAWQQQKVLQGKLSSHPTPPPKTYL